MSSTTAEHHVDYKGEQEKFYAFVNLALFMAFVTGMELVIIFIPFANWIVFTIIVVLSAVKFFGVITWFMHLIYDKLFCTVLFMMGLVIAACTCTALMLLFSPADIVPLDELSAIQPILQAVVA